MYVHVCAIALMLRMLAIFTIKEINHASHDHVPQLRACNYHIHVVWEQGVWEEGITLMWKLSHENMVRY